VRKESDIREAGNRSFAPGGGVTSSSGGSLERGATKGMAQEKRPGEKGAKYSMRKKSSGVSAITHPMVKAG